MRKLLFVAVLALWPGIAWGQCTGVFQPGQVCGNTTGSPGPPAAASLGFVISSSAIRVPTRSSALNIVTVNPVTDYFLCLDPTGNAITVNLPASPGLGSTYLIKDCTGQASTHSITVTPASGNIDGAGTFVMGTAFQSIAVTFTGTQWSVN